VTDVISGVCGRLKRGAKRFNALIFIIRSGRKACQMNAAHINVYCL
jgi:hypothetical protein